MKKIEDKICNYYLSKFKHSPPGPLESFYNEEVLICLCPIG